VDCCEVAMKMVDSYTFSVCDIIIPKDSLLVCAGTHIRVCWGKMEKDTRYSDTVLTPEKILMVSSMSYLFCFNSYYFKQTPWPDPRAKYTDRATAACRRSWCHATSVTDPYGRILGFLDRSRYFFFRVAPQLYSRGWVEPVPDPLLLRKCGSAGNRTQTFGSVARNCGR
jgi:hypothetical protein